MRDRDCFSLDSFACLWDSSSYWIALSSSNAKYLFLLQLVMLCLSHLPKGLVFCEGNHKGVDPGERGCYRTETGGRGCRRNCCPDVLYERRILKKKTEKK